MWASGNPLPTPSFNKILDPPLVFFLSSEDGHVQGCTGQLAALGAVVAVQFIIIILLIFYVVLLKRAGKSYVGNVLAMGFWFDGQGASSSLGEGGLGSE